MSSGSETQSAPAADANALACTCPGGDGSLRWPCPQHPPAGQLPPLPRPAAEQKPVPEHDQPGVLLFTSRQMRDFGHACYRMGQEAASRAPATSAAGQDAQDAARYRWLRNQNILDLVGSFAPYVVQGQTMRMLEGAEVDRAVDSAMHDRPAAVGTVGLPLDVEFKRLADTILQATTNSERNEALRGMAALFDKRTAAGDA